MWNGRCSKGFAGEIVVFISIYDIQIMNSRESLVGLFEYAIKNDQSSFHQKLRISEKKQFRNVKLISMKTHLLLFGKVRNTWTDFWELCLRLQILYTFSEIFVVKFLLLMEFLLYGKFAGSYSRYSFMFCVNHFHIFIN